MAISRRFKRSIGGKRSRRNLRRNTRKIGGKRSRRNSRTVGGSPNAYAAVKTAQNVSDWLTGNVDATFNADVRDRREERRGEEVGWGEIFQKNIAYVDPIPAPTFFRNAPTPLTDADRQGLILEKYKENPENFEKAWKKLEDNDNKGWDFLLNSRSSMINSDQAQSTHRIVKELGGLRALKEKARTTTEMLSNYGAKAYKDMSALIKAMSGETAREEKKQKEECGRLLEDATTLRDSFRGMSGTTTLPRPKLNEIKCQMKNKACTFDDTTFEQLKDFDALKTIDKEERLQAFKKSNIYKELSDSNKFKEYIHGLDLSQGIKKGEETRKEIVESIDEQNCPAVGGKRRRRNTRKIGGKKRRRNTRKIGGKRRR